ncbi:MAG: SIS domain-containing protein, partial [Planctomycetes bacterium]|nr:SIS domain-containing protein [Planctomycetota bacterium]
MSSVAQEQFVPHSQLEQLREGRRILKAEADALLGLAQNLGRDFCDAVNAIFHCQGRVIVTGVGKAGLIGHKISATLSSTGTPSHFLHPVEAVHGDLGCVDASDALLVLSNSGESKEVCRLLPIVKR